MKKTKKCGLGAVAVIMVFVMTACTNNTGSSNPVFTSALPGNTSEEPSSVSTDETAFIPGIYVDTVSCGYLSQEKKPEDLRYYLITTEEEVEYAEKELGMKLPEDEDELWNFNDSVANAFQEMKQKYPIADYSYLFCYTEYSQGGHYHHSDAVQIVDDQIYFHYDQQKSPPEGEPAPDMMDGVFDLAAIPKSEIAGKIFTNVIYPLQYGYYDIEYVFDDPLFVQIIDGDILPVEVRHGLGGEGGYNQDVSTDPKIIQGYIDALRKLNIGEVIENEDDMVRVMDAINDYIFILEDGKEVLISLDADAYVEKDGKQYVFDNNHDLKVLNKKMQSN